MPATRLSERVGADVWLKIEGANPTGSFKDRGMTCAVSAALRDGAEAVICASTGNTAASAAAYAGRAGLTGAVIVPEGKIATGKLAQALVHGARVIALRGNFDAALKLVRELVQRHPIALVNSVNPYRLEGQKTAAFELLDELGELDALCIPVGNAGNITAYWKGFQEAGASPRMLGFQAEGAAPLVDGAPVENPETVASAIRIGNPARWEEAMGAMTESQGAIRAVSDAEILDAYRWLAAHEGVFCEPASAAGVAGLLRYGAEGAGRIVCVLTGHGLEGPAGRARPRGLRRPLRAGHRRGRAGRHGLVRRRRRIRVPASSANLGPGFDVLAAALAMHIDVEVVETGRFAVHTDLSIARDRRNLVVRGFARAAPARRVRVPHRLRRPARRAASARARPPTSPACSPRTRSSSSTPTSSRSRPSSRATPTTSPRRCSAGSSCAPTARRCASTRRPGSRRCSSCRTARCAPRRRGRLLPAEVPMADAVFNVAHASLLVLGLAQGRLDLVARGLADRLHQPRRAALYPESMALVERATEFGALGASISGAGPTVLVWSVYDATAGLVERLRAETEGWADVRRVPFEPQGADVRALT